MVFQNFGDGFNEEPWVTYSAQGHLETITGNSNCLRVERTAKQKSQGGLDLTPSTYRAGGKTEAVDQNTPAKSQVTCRWLPLPHRILQPVPFAVHVQPAWPPRRKVEAGPKSPGVPAAHGTCVMG